MKKFVFKIISIFFTLLFVVVTTSFAQTNTALKVCTKHLNESFVSDGQQYKALLNGDEVAEFRATFYEGSIYRIIGCSGLSDGNLIFSVYDKNRRLLFSNLDHNITPYWDFKFNSTIDCIIEAQLEDTSKSGFAILLIGFKKH